MNKLFVAGLTVAFLGISSLSVHAADRVADDTDSYGACLKNSDPMDRNSCEWQPKEDPRALMISRDWDADAVPAQPTSPCKA